MKKTLIFLLCSVMNITAFAQNFDDFFEDKTLRVDYIFTGDAGHLDIYLDELSSLPEWAGRRHHLSEIPLGGNGEITMKDKATGQVIYRTSFSSLFQEWVTEEEASRVRKGFENSFLLPYPKKEAVVTVALKNVYHKSTRMTFSSIREDWHVSPLIATYYKAEAPKIVSMWLLWQKVTQSKRWIFSIRTHRQLAMLYSVTNLSRS